MRRAIGMGLFFVTLNSMAATYYVDASRPDDSGNGLNWGTAKKNIQMAVNMSVPGDCLMVTNGVYAPISTGNNSILIQSVNGARFTFIDGGGTSRCATLGSVYFETNTVLSGFTLRNGRVDGGDGSYYGGGSYMGTLNNCTLTGNSAMHGGGGGSYGGILNNCMLTGNSAAYGGGSSEGTLNNCTLTANSATEFGGGSDHGKLSNCIVWNNDAVLTGSDNYFYSVCRYSCAFPLPEGEGNIPEDPRFTDSVNGDFRLRSGSPCIDAGLNAYVVGNKDINGANRIQNGIVDMGAAEGAVAGFVISVRLEGIGVVSPMSAVVNSGGASGFTAATQGRPFICFVTNNVFASSSPDFTWTNITADGVLTARFLTCDWHVDASRPDDSGDGMTPETAKRTIQSAVDVSLLGDTVSVTDGIYESVATGNKALMIRSVNGKEATIIDGGGTNRCATLGSHPFHTNTVLSGFTLRNGGADGENGSYDGGGAYAGTMNNCTLTGNSATNSGGGSYGGTLNNCTLTGNSADTGGGSSWGTLNNCTLAGNSARFGGGSLDGMLNNCTLSGNSAAYGGGSGPSTLNNCTLSGNSAAYGGGSFWGMLNNCTLTGNSATRGGGSDGSTLNNCIVWNNDAALDGSDNYSSSVFRYSCAFPLPDGEGNISEDPRFTDAVNGDFRLLSDSPCRDAGNNSFVSTMTDLAGQIRIFGSVVDMGAFEIASVTDHISRLLNWPLEAVGLCGTTLGAGLEIRFNSVVIKGVVLGDSASSGFTLMSQDQGRLTFRWNVSSEYYFDTLNFYVDNVLTAQISGKNVTWAGVTNTVLTAGPHTFKWEYDKDGDTSVGQDSAWIADVVWMPAMTGTPTPVPYVWLDQFPTLLALAGGSYDSAALADVDGDGHTAMQEYITGSIPTNRASILRAVIDIVDGHPRIMWTPDLGAQRIYTIDGKTNLIDTAWHSPTNAGSRFFRVNVEMP